MIDRQGHDYLVSAVEARNPLASFDAPGRAGRMGVDGGRPPVDGDLSDLTTAKAVQETTT